jgi:hypothetical protein
MNAPLLFSLFVEQGSQDVARLEVPSLLSVRAKIALIFFLVTSGERTSR